MTSPGRGAPLLVTAELPPGLRAWADALRNAHYPPGRMRLGAHVTLFHALPPSAGAAVTDLLAAFARRDPPEARITGIMSLGSGTAFAVDSPAMAAIREELAERLHGLVQQKDARPLRLHVTVQNKVSRGAAEALQAQLSATFTPRAFRFQGFGLHEWRDELWRQARVFAFRGQGASGC